MPIRLSRTRLRRLALAGAAASTGACAVPGQTLPPSAQGFATFPLPSLGKFIAKLSAQPAETPSQAQPGGEGPIPARRPDDERSSWRERISALLVSGDVRAPRAAVVLCHGLFGFDKRTILPFLVDHYWRDISVALEHIGCRVLVARVPSTGDVRERAWALRNLVESAGGPVNLLAHSMGGLDARYLISHLPPTTHPVLSLTTIATPHRGSPFMDYLRDVLGVGFRYDDPHLRQVLEKRAAEIGGRSGGMRAREGRTRELGRSLDVLEGSADEDPTQPPRHHNHPVEPSPLRSALDSVTESASSSSIPLPSAANPGVSDSASAAGTSPSESPPTPFPSIPPTNPSALRHLFAPLDRPAYHALTTDFCTRVFNPLTPDNPNVAYFSYGAYVRDMPVANLLKFSHGVIMERHGENDGLVSLGSARWGEYLGTVEADHWDLNGRWRVKVGKKFDAPMFWAQVATRLNERGF